MKDSSSATERVGRYQLLEPIGGGPNGIVARAKVFGVAGFERQFAVKRFHADLTTGPAAQALSAAARSYGSLEHPRIARMSEFGVAQGQTFTAVEFVPGLDVFRLLQEAKLASVAIAAGGALALVSQAARAVGYAHGRGLSHLGLSPTNVIVTADGDVKVTDFGILAATMPANPLETQRLASRVPYLSPEQIAGEATSAATDVFVLGVIAYELVTGQRAYRGDSPAAIGQAILAGPPPEPPLPRPIVRVLQRCLARSPFERFPDARALADALDAALRVAPVPGTRKDVGAQVKTTLERYAQLNEGNVSGMVALNLNSGSPPPSSGRNDATQPLLPPTQPLIPSRPEARTEPSGTPTFSAPTPLNQTREMPRDLLRPPATVPGIAPPPLGVPPGVTIPSSSSTIPGFTPAGAKKPPVIPSIKPPPLPPKPPGPPPAKQSFTQSWDAMGDVTVSPDAPTDQPAPPPKPTSLTQGWDAMPDVPTTPPSAPAPAPGRSLTQGWDAMSDIDLATIARPAAPAVNESDDDELELGGQTTAEPVPSDKRPTPAHSFESATGEMSRAQLEDLNRRAVMTTSQQMPVARPEEPPPPLIVIAPEREPEAEEDLGSETNLAVDTSLGTETNLASITLPHPPRTLPHSEPLPLPAPAASSVERVVPSTPDEPALPVAPASRSRMPLIAGIAALGVLASAGFIAYSRMHTRPATTTVAAGSGSGSSAAVRVTPPPTLDAAAEAPVRADAAVAVATAPVDAAAAVEIDAAPVAVAVDAATQVAASGSNGSGAGSGSGSADEGKPQVVKPTGTSDQLQVTSVPDGARVFLDGSELGKTPLTVPGSADRHTLTVLLPGHDLYLAEVDGHGKYDVALVPVKPTKAGPGIKVETCKVKDRYYIYVDGVASGQTCPTAKRIVTTLGKHTVEVYDIVTETRKKYDVDLKDDRLSFRIKIED